MADQLHSAMSGSDLHDPKGVDPTPLDLDKNIAASYLIRWDSDGLGGAYRDVFRLRTTDLACRVEIGNTSDGAHATEARWYVWLTELTTTPGTPTSGWFSVYVKTDGKIYGKNDAGTEYDLTSTGLADSDVVFNVLEKSADYTVVAGDMTGLGTFIIVNSSAAARTITLPAISAANKKPIYVARSGENDVTVQRAGSDTVMGGTTSVLSVDGMTVGFLKPASGVDWRTF